MNPQQIYDAIKRAVQNKTPTVFFVQPNGDVGSLSLADFWDDRDAEWQVQLELRSWRGLPAGFDICWVGPDGDGDAAVYFLAWENEGTAMEELVTRAAVNSRKRAEILRLLELAIDDAHCRRKAHAASAAKAGQ